jgi:hypothetical protein
LSRFGYEKLNEDLATLNFKTNFKTLNDIYPGYGFSQGKFDFFKT